MENVGYQPLSDPGEESMSRVEELEGVEDHGPEYAPSTDEYAPVCTSDLDTLENGSPTEPMLLFKERGAGSKKIRDPVFLAAFGVHVVAVLIMGIKEAIQIAQCGCVSSSAWRWLWLVMSLSVLGVATSVGVLYALSQFLHMFVIAVMLTSCALPLILTIFSTAAGSWYMIIPGLLGSGLAFVCLNLAKSRIDFATVLLSVVMGALKKFPELLVMAILALIPQLIWSFFVFVTIYGTAVTFSFESKIVSTFQFMFLILSAFWTFQVVRNIIHVTTAGTISTWYFKPDGQYPPHTARNSLHRACTASLGSICFGSLLIAVMQVVRYVAQNCRRQNKYPALHKFGVLVARVLEGVMAYFNKYALVYVAVYGYDFMQSAKNLGRRVSACGVTAVLNDDITGVVLMFVGMLNGLLVAFVAVVVTALLGQSLTISTFITCVWIGYMAASVTTSVISSGVATLFVCYMEESAALRDSHPDAYNAISSAWIPLYGPLNPNARPQL